MADLKEKILEQINIPMFYQNHLGVLPEPNSINEISVQCPFHSDKDPSLSINLKTGYYKCFGCDAHGDVFTFQEKIKDQPFSVAIHQMAKDLDISTSNEKTHFDYKDKDGNATYRIIRFEDGKGIPHRPDGFGGWTPGIKGHVELVPFNLPSLLDPANADKTIHICEGEPDAITLTDLDYIATTNALGAQNWKSEYNQYFTGRDVIIHEDNDQAGRDRSKKISEALASTAKSIKVVQYTELEEKGDVTDFLNSLSSSSKMRMKMSLGAKIKATPYIGAVTANEDGMKVPATVDDIMSIINSCAITSTDFINEDIPIPRTIIDPWLVDGSISMLFAERGVGKTWLSIILAMIITRQDATTNKSYNIGSWTCNNSAGVIYVDGEMGPFDMQYRMKKLQQGMGMENKEAPFLLLSSSKVSSKNNTQVNINNPLWRQAMYDYLLEHEEYRLIILDNIASLSPGIEENSKMEWDIINQWLLSIKAMGRGVLLIHHAGKEGKQRGTSGREDNLDVIIKLKKPSGYNVNDGAYFAITFEKARNMGPKADLNPFTLKISEHANGTISWNSDHEVGERELLTALLLDDRVHGKELTDITGTSKMSISRARTKLEKDGLVDRKKRITSKGVKVLNEFKAKHDLEQYYV